MREDTSPRHLTVDEALDRAQEVDGGPVVLEDVSDNAGGGAPSDATFILERVIGRGIREVANWTYWDPQAVQLCMEAGQGARLRLCVGGKCGATSGAPIDLDVTVEKIAENATQSFGTATIPMGDTVWVSADGIDLVLNSIRTQVFNLDAMAGLDLDPRTRRRTTAQHGIPGPKRDLVHLSRRCAPRAARLLVPVKRGPLAVPCVGVRPRQLPALARLAHRGRALVGHDAAGEADQDRREGGAPWPLRDLPTRRGRCPALFVRQHPAPDRQSLTPLPP